MTPVISIGGIAIAGIAAVVLTATAGDVLVAAAMRQLGDLDEVKAKSGMLGTIRAVVSNPVLVAGATCMALSFFSLLFTLSHADVSLVAPAAGSLTFVSNAAAAKFFLKEHVDRRRWIAAILVCVGVVLLKR
jgi:drug/metabolite transporter (DMT)-like permease